MLPRRQPYEGVEIEGSPANLAFTGKSHIYIARKYKLCQKTLWHMENNIKLVIAQTNYGIVSSSSFRDKFY